MVVLRVSASPVRTALTVVMGTTMLVLAQPPAAEATACGDLAMAPAPGPPLTNHLVTLPRQLVGRAVPPEAVTVRQDGRRLEVTRFNPVAPTRLDVVVVLDASTDTPDAFFRAARNATTTLLDELPDAARVAVVSASGRPAVLAGLSADRSAARSAVELAPRAPGRALIDGLGLAADVLTDPGRRFRHVVLVAGGAEDASVRDYMDVRPALAQQAVSLHVLDFGQTPAMPSLGEQCPPRVRQGEGRVAGRVIAASIAGGHRLVVAGARGDAPLNLLLRLDETELTATSATTLADPTVAEEANVQGRKVSAPPTVEAERTDPRMQAGTDAGGWPIVSLAVTVLGLMLLAVMSVRFAPLLAARARATGMARPQRRHKISSVGPPPQRPRPDDARVLDRPATAAAGPAPAAQAAAVQQGRQSVATIPVPSPPRVGRAPDLTGGPISARSVAEELRDLNLEVKAAVATVHRQSRIARVSLLALIPFVVVARFWSGSGWLAEAFGSLAGAVTTIAALLLTLAGSIWVVRVTRPPYPLWPHRGNDVEEAIESPRARLRAAERLALQLATTGSPTEARRVLRDVAILRRAQLLSLVGHEDRIAVVTILPFATCLLPAVLLLLLV